MKNHICKILLPAFLYLLINVLFVDKYTMRITEWHFLCDALYLFFGIGLMLLVVWLQTCNWKFKPIVWSLGIMYIVSMIYIQFCIDPMTLQVDRWSAIHNFLYNLFHGIYPYAAQTHLGGYGSPFPVWQILHIPFYFIGNVGLSFFVALVLFLYVLAKFESPRVALTALLLIIFSPAINYEVVVRSDLFTNFLVICTLCEWLRHQEILLDKHLYCLAIIIGLCASTRLTAVIPLAYLYGYAFLRLGLKKQAAFVGIVCLTFALTFLPFILWNGEQLIFFEYNPFVLQTRQGSPLVLVLFATIAIVWTIYKKDRLQYFYLQAGGLLTLLVLMTFTYNMIISGDYHLYSSTYDISYFNMALPFYVCAIAMDTNP